MHPNSTQRTRLVLVGGSLGYGLVNGWLPLLLTLTHWLAAWKIPGDRLLLGTLLLLFTLGLAQLIGAVGFFKHQAWAGRVCEACLFGSLPLPWPLTGCSPLTSLNRKHWRPLVAVGQDWYFSAG